MGSYFPAAFLFVVLVATVLCTIPCDRSNPKSLCLRPVSHSIRRVGGGRGGRRGSRGGGGSSGEDEDEDEDGEGEEEMVCFPSLASVIVKRGQLEQRVQMHQLEVGDQVLLADGTFSPVFMFSHRETKGIFSFITLHTTLRNITLTKGHYVYTDAGVMAASAVATSHSLEVSWGRYERVLGVSKTLSQGLYNPHTLAAELLVDGVRVSAYTKAVKPVVAMALLVPFRAMFSAFAFDFSFDFLSQSPPASLTKVLPRGT